MTSESDKQAFEDPRQHLAHDIRNALYVMSIHLKMIATQEHNDAVEIDKHCQAIDKERQTVTRLFNEYHRRSYE